MFLIGMGIERVALRRLAGRPIIMILMMTLGAGHLPARRQR
jgi:branched-chain amino acid transport system permease protein